MERTDRYTGTTGAGGFEPPPPPRDPYEEIRAEISGLATELVKISGHFERLIQTASAGTVMLQAVLNRITEPIRRKEDQLEQARRRTTEASAAELGRVVQDRIKPFSEWYPKIGDQARTRPKFHGSPTACYYCGKLERLTDFNFCARCMNELVRAYLREQVLPIVVNL